MTRSKTDRIAVMSILAATTLGVGAIGTSRDQATLRSVGLLLPASLPEIMFFFQLGDDAGAKVTGRWIAADVGPTAPPDYLIDSLSLTLRAGEEASFTLGRPENGWPLGRYRLVIAVDGAETTVVPFVIQDVPSAR